MSNTKNTGGPAFPRSLDASSGMTLRDHFAGLAMQGHYRSCYGYDDFQDARDIGMGAITMQSIAEQSYAMADAMLKAREQ
jgi:hypothetical protein